MGVRQNPWTPTKRRGPIAAEAASPGPAVVSLPTLIGKPPQESKKSRAPAFTFGQKHESVSVGKLGPGPASYNVEGMTSKGRASGPAVSLLGRWPPLRVTPTPAPCDYEPSKASKATLLHAPAFSIGLRVSPPQPGAKTPAPNIYSMPPVLGEAKEGGKRAAPAFSITGRGKTAEIRTPMPGPGTYTTDRAEAALSRRPPAFTIAPRRETKSTTAIPGPGAHCPEKANAILHDRSPSHTMSGRNRSTVTVDQNPAPNAYNPEKADRMLREKSPAYSFRIKTEVHKVSSAPAPNVYSPEKALNTLKSGPKYTLAGKGIAEKHEVTPAPNTYNPQRADKVLHESSPSYTMSSKKTVQKIEQTPGPNVYAPEKSMHMLNGGPKYTLSGKGCNTKIIDTPAPNSYSPEKADKVLHESSPAYSFRTKEQVEICSTTPGPNVYAPEKSMHMLDSTPKYTIGGKGHSPKPQETPGPNVYAVEKSMHMLDGSPKFTISGKGHEAKIYTTPAPNAYCADKADKLLHDSSPAYSFRPKIPMDKPNQNPGPNVYDPHRLDGTPKYSLYGKGADAKIYQTPGPNAYDPHVLDGTPKFTISGKGLENKTSDSPGPAAYYPHLFDGTPKYTMGGKGSDGKPSDTPGPNSYSPHLPSNTPQYTISGKGHDGKVSDTPGPNAYEPHLIDGSLKYSLYGKGKSDKPSDTPGPNVYDPHLPNGTPQYTIGGKGSEEKHSDYPGPGAYTPHLPNGAPRYTISGKGVDAKLCIVPAPNAYDPHLLDNSPKYTMGGNGKPGIVVDTPGPASYTPEKADNVHYEHSPAYTFGTKQPSHLNNNTPAPNAYEPNKYDYMLDGVPKYSFGIKRPAEKPSSNPAPNAYNPEKADNVLHEHSPAYSFRPKIDDTRVNNTPGPNAYNPDKADKVLHTSPAYSLYPKGKDDKINSTPAPNAYNPDKADKILLDNAPRYSFRIKTNPRKADNNPAPNCYNPDKADKVLSTSAPQYTFRIKTDALKIPDTPAPNCYTIPSQVRTPLYTISGRHKDPIDERLKVPAPNTYSPEKATKFVLTYSPQYTFGVKIHTDKFSETPAPNTYRIPSVLETPVYTISGRHKVPVDERTKVPAPGTYSPEKVQLSKAPQITFGIKHSPLLGQLKPIEHRHPIHHDREVTQKVGSQYFADSKHLELHDVQHENQNSESVNHLDDSTKISEHSLFNQTYNQQRFNNEAIDATNATNIQGSSRLTQIRAENDLRSATGTPEPVQETLTQEIVWDSEKPIARRGSYTIEDDGSSYIERYQDGSVVSVQNGIIRTAVQGERSGSAQLSKTPQSTFGNKHSPLLGQLKSIEPLHHQREVTQNIGSQHFADSKHLELTDVQYGNKNIENVNHLDNSTKISEHSLFNQTYNQQRFNNEAIDDTNATNIQGSSCLTGTPEPLHETIARRSSYTLEDGGSSYLERYQDGNVVPVQNGNIRTDVQGEKRGSVRQESNSKVIRGDGFEQSIQRDVKATSAHEKTQAATEEVRTGTEVQKLANGGIAKTTKTTTIKKIGTAARAVNASTSVTRTATAITSRDVGAK